VCRTDLASVLIYILISVAIFVFSAISNAKKRKKARELQPSEQAQQTEGYFDYHAENEEDENEFLEKPELKPEATSEANDQDYVFGNYRSPERKKPASGTLRVFEES